MMMDVYRYIPVQLFYNQQKQKQKQNRNKLI